MNASVSASDLRRIACMSVCRNTSAAFDHRHRHDRLRAAQEARDARIGRETRLHRERCAVAPPAGQRLREVRVMALRHHTKAGEPGPPFRYCAADRAVRARAVQVDRHRAGRVCEIPHQPACVVHELRDGRHVVHVAGAVVHVRDHRDGRVRERAGQVGRVVDQAQFVVAAELLDQPLRDIQVGRKFERSDTITRRSARARPGAPSPTAA